MEQVRLLTKDIGSIDPISAAQYRGRGGYRVLEHYLKDPGSIIGDIGRTGLRGRGGAGFPVARKWEMVRAENAAQKYVVCNADEGEPETNKDRVLLCGKPHAVFEGILIAGLAAGANRGILYIRAEYPYLHTTLQKAIDDAYAGGFLGKHVCGSDFDFDLELRTGQGAYLCGEETALLESIEGRRGETRLKPPYPGVSGLWGKPTIINNVETMACVPAALSPEEDFRRYGTGKCPGTKLYTVCGHVEKPGVYEYPMGVPVRTLLDAAGGMRGGGKLLAVQTGGASGTFVRPSLLDMPFDIESCAANAATFGTGSLMFVDESASLVDICLNLVCFYALESCGKCVPCRLGLRKAVKMLDLICRQGAGEDELGELEDLAAYIRRCALCGLGAAAPTPVLSLLGNFRSELVSGRAVS